MKIGTDANLAVCRTEGYMVMEFSKRSLIKKGKLDKVVNVHFTKTNYLFWKKGKPIPGCSRQYLFVTDIELSWNDVFEKYMKHKDKIDDFADFKNCPISTDDPTEYDLLNLADAIDSYCGLE